MRAGRALAGAACAAAGFAFPQAGVSAQPLVPGETPGIRQMGLAVSAETTVRRCPTTFQIKPQVAQRQASLVELARTRYPRSYEEFMAKADQQAGAAQGNCVRAAVNFFCNVRRHEFLELTGPARKKLNEAISSLRFDETTFPKTCRDQSPL